MSTGEQWKPIPDWLGYEVSNQGRVRSWKKSRQTPSQALPRVLSPYALPSGYLLVTLKDKGRRKNRYIHRMVLLAFMGRCPDGMEAAHCDGSKVNNHLSNLRYATPTENNADKRRHGTHVEGSQHHAARLTDAQARTIYSHPGSTTEAAALFGVSYFIAWHVRAGRTYKNATKDLR